MLTWESHKGSPSPDREGQKMKHYVVLKSCNAGGARRNAGDVVELTDSEGNALIQMGRVSVTNAPKPAPKTAAMKKSNRAVKLEDSDVAPLETREEDGASDSE